MADPSPPQNPAAAADRPAPTWSPAQLARLEAEWRRLRRGFAFHPHVRVVALAGEPPTEFRVEYGLRALVMDDAGELAYADACAVHLSLPPQFPHAGPTVRALVGVFHPNVAGDVVHFAPGWNPATSSLVDVVARCGEMLALQVYDPAAVHNPTAMQWVAAYPNLVPTDPNAVLAPDAGEDALQRIARLGPAALERYRAELSGMARNILDAAPGSERRDVREFGGRVSVELDVFADPDVPADLRMQAAELDEWARSLTHGRSVWHDVRSLVAHARAAAESTAGLNAARDAVGAALAVVARLVEAGPAEEPKDTIARLPQVVALDPVVIRLRGATRELGQRLSELRAALDGLSGPPLSPAGDPGTLLHEQTSAAVGASAAEAAAARQAGRAAVEAAEPAFDRARLEQQAIEVVAAWAAFADLVRRGNDLAHRLEWLGAAGLQAYFLHTPGGRFGPYQFEERVDVGAAAVLVVRRNPSGQLEVFDARSMGLLAHAAAAAPVRFKLPDADRKVHDAEVRATEHAEALRVQLDYLVQTAREQLDALLHARFTGKADAWPVRFAHALCGPASLHVAADMHRLASHRWTALLADLDELAPFKERLATFHLVERHTEYVPAVLAARGKAEASLREAGERLAFIAARSSRDVDTGAVLVEPQFAEEYARRVAQRERAERDLSKVRRLLALVTAELQARLADRRLLGKAGLPRLRVLAAATPETFGVTEQGLSDAHIQARLADLRRTIEAP